MNPQDFVDALRQVVMSAAVTDVVSMVERPPGRRPAAELLQLSGWYNSLTEDKREMVRRLSELVARHAVFGVLSVLDGARQIEPEGAKGHLELRYVKDGAEEVLSGPAGVALHELL